MQTKPESLSLSWANKGETEAGVFVVQQPAAGVCSTQGAALLQSQTSDCNVESLCNIFLMKTWLLGQELIQKSPTLHYMSAGADIKGASTKMSLITIIRLHCSLTVF